MCSWLSLPSWKPATTHTASRTRFPVGGHAGKQMVHSDAVGEGHHQLVDYLVGADGPGDPLPGGIRRPVADEDLLVEPAYLVPADPSGQDRDAIEVRVAGHGRHCGVQVPAGELRRQVVIEHVRQPAVPLGTRHAHPPISGPAAICPGRTASRRSRGHCARIARSAAHGPARWVSTSRAFTRSPLRARRAGRIVSRAVGPVLDPGRGPAPRRPAPGRRVQGPQAGADQRPDGTEGEAGGAGPGTSGRLWL